mgnify:CR=1 FL=1
MFVVNYWHKDDAKKSIGKFKTEREAKAFLLNYMEEHVYEFTYDSDWFMKDRDTLCLEERYSASIEKDGKEIFFKHTCLGIYDAEESDFPNTDEVQNG